MSGSSALTLTATERAELLRLTEGSSSTALRARIVLLSAEGLSVTAVAERLGTSRPTVATWRTRYLAAGLRGLRDSSRPGRPRIVDSGAVVRTTLLEPPAVGRRWTCRGVASRLGISGATVARTWQEYGIRPAAFRGLRPRRPARAGGAVADGARSVLGPGGRGRRPVRGSPVRGSPVRGSPVRGSGRHLPATCRDRLGARSPPPCPGPDGTHRPPRSGGRARGRGHAWAGRAPSLARHAGPVVGSARRARAPARARSRLGAPASGSAPRRNRRTDKGFLRHRTDRIASHKSFPTGRITPLRLLT